MAKKVSGNNIIAELRLAHSTEIAGYFFYKFVAGMVSDKKGKNVFNHLAAEEMEHIKVVKSIADSIQAGAGWMSYDDALKKGKPVSAAGLKIFPSKSEMTERLKKNQTDLNAINISLEAEEKAVHFYGNMLKKAKEPNEKMLLTRLLEMEKGHLKILRWESESLRRTGFWAGQMEYSVEKEADESH